MLCNHADEIAEEGCTCPFRQMMFVDQSRSEMLGHAVRAFQLGDEQELPTHGNAADTLGVARMVRRLRRREPVTDLNVAPWGVMVDVTDFGRLGGVPWLG